MADDTQTPDPVPTAAPPKGEPDKTVPPPDDGKGPIDMSDTEDLKRAARKHERQAKEALKRAEEAEARLSEIDQANKSEAEKAIEKAREEARREAKDEANAELRKERLDAAIARRAAGKFADVDDAIALLDSDDVFDDEGKVDNTALTKALDDLLAAKPHLAAREPGPGDPDAGKGSTNEPSIDEMSVDDHLKAIQARKG